MQRAGRRRSSVKDSFKHIVKDEQSSSVPVLVALQELPVEARRQLVDWIFRPCC